MKLRTMLLMSSLCVLLAPTAQAVDMAAGQALAQKSNCLGCHSVDKKMMGPAYKDVAMKYKGDPDAVAKLTKKVKEGGKGVWGPIPMPANGPRVSDADIKTLVEWVLAN